MTMHNERISPIQANLLASFLRCTRAFEHRVFRWTANGSGTFGGGGHSSGEVGLNLPFCGFIAIIRYQVSRAAVRAFVEVMGTG